MTQPNGMANTSDVQPKEPDNKRNSFTSVNAIEDAVKFDHVQDTNMRVYGHAEHVTYTDEENKRVLRKIDLILLPMLGACYMFSVRDCDHNKTQSVQANYGPGASFSTRHSSITVPSSA